MNYSRLTCPHCGGSMEIINIYSDHYLCDTCDYEINLDGVINPGIWDYIEKSNKKHEEMFEKLKGDK